MSQATKTSLASVDVMTASAASQDSCRRSLVAGVLLVSVAVGIYANSFDVPLVLDGEFLLQNESSLAQVWPWKMLVGRNRPVGFFSFGLNYALGGFNVWGYHAVNLAVHVAAAFALFGIVRRTLARGRLKPQFHGASWGLALAVALIWLAHPLETQSVTYISQRFESLMGLFYLLTLYSFIRAQDSVRPG